MELVFVVEFWCREEAKVPEKPEIFEQYAEECGRRAERAHAPDIRAIFEELARDWRELARLRRRLDADRGRAAHRPSAPPAARTQRGRQPDPPNNGMDR